MCYHSVTADWEDALAVTPGDFARQCSWLQRHRRVVAARRLVPLVAAGRRVPRGAVALTFDDGFADFYDQALPVLTRHRLPAALFVVARTLQDEEPARADWLRPQPAVGPRTLTRGQVLHLRDAGVEIGSHSWAHHDLRELSEEEAVRDLRDSRELLEDLLGQPAPMLAYPYGFHAPHVRRAARRAGYEYALSLPEGPEQTGTHAVPRVGVYRHNGLAVVRAKSTSLYLPARTSRAYRAVLGARRRLSSSTSL